MDIIERMRAGEVILNTDPDYPKLYAEFEKTMSICGRLNAGYHTPDEIRALLSEIWHQEIDPTVRMFPPFYTNFGGLTSVGKNVFINFNCTFLARGGISIGDNVLIGPGVMLLTENHPEEPTMRDHLYSLPIRIKSGAWIGAGAKILSGVTIGENAIVGAGALVTKDVPDNMVAVGAPAKVIREIKRDGKLG